MRKRTLIIVGSVAIILVAVFVAFTLSRPAIALPVTVSFISYTNPADGSVRLATFAITNHSTATVLRRAIYYPESHQQPGRALTVHAVPAVFLGPGQSEVISVPTPTNQGEWRGVFICTREGWRRRFADWCGRGSGGLIDVVVPTSLRGAPSQQVRSDWIDL